ncbi:CYFA0S13e01706g1_1 [Cyberlindnera fabianii]|uniref:non-specific serine/threonine protein kinase n=1 Tax=Cyberlindnera fabianii TaxID=36022 RepID=A0A061B2L5_CYBFA|nr:CYFA0S13e01706g1_1 [Cyberlindnera fabianii]
MSFLFSCFPCFTSDPVLIINRAKFKILKLLGEGGFSYVYLVQASNGATYALKKIRCPFGAESMRIAMTEVENYREFHSPYIIRAIDSSTVQEEDGSKTVYILLPYFERSLQDVINTNAIESTQIDEAEAIRIFIGICRGLQSMHRHQPNHRSVAMNEVNMNVATSEHERLLLDASTSNITDDDTASLAETIPSMSTGPINDEDAQNGTELTETIAYAHRDIKPANVMLSKDGLPVLCDLGSCAKARITAKNRSTAVAIQELAAEHCTLPYRAPELLDVKTGAHLDEKIDIWSLGCLLYALLYGCSPFEHEEAESGGSMNMAISNGKWEYPKRGDVYSDDIKELIEMCLVVDPEQRPAVEDVLTKALAVQSRS